MLLLLQGSVGTILRFTALGQKSYFLAFASIAFQSKLSTLWHRDTLAKVTACPCFWFGEANFSKRKVFPLSEKPLIPFSLGMFPGELVGRPLPMNILTFLQSQVFLNKGHWQTWLKDDDVAKMPWKPEMLFGS